MPQFTSPLTIDDGAAVAVTYSVEKLASESSIFVDRRLATREAQPTLTVSFDRATPTRKTYKVKHVVAYPLVRTIAGVDLVQDVARVNLEYILPQNMTAGERKNVKALVANAQSQALIKAGVEDLDPLY